MKSQRMQGGHMTSRNTKPKTSTLRGSRGIRCCEERRSKLEARRRRRESHATIMRVKLPMPCELQVDLDSLESVQTFWTLFDVIRRAIDGHCIADVYPSKTDGHFHAVVRLPYEVSDLERVALQAILRSDPVREIRNYLRVKSNAPCPILFIEAQKHDRM